MAIDGAVQDALAQSDIEAQVEAVRSLLAVRYRALRAALDTVDPQVLKPLPFNSGCFALVEMPAGVDAEAARHHLLDHYDTGLVSIGSAYLRVAFCSVAASAIPEMIERLGQGVAELAARG